MGDGITGDQAQLHQNNSALYLQDTGTTDKQEPRSEALSKTITAVNNAIRRTSTISRLPTILLKPGDYQQRNARNPAPADAIILRDRTAVSNFDDGTVPLLGSKCPQGRRANSNQQASTVAPDRNVSSDLSAVSNFSGSPTTRQAEPLASMGDTQADKQQITERYHQYLVQIDRTLGASIKSLLTNENDENLKPMIYLWLSAGELRHTLNNVTSPTKDESLKHLAGFLMQELVKEINERGGELKEWQKLHTNLITIMTRAEHRNRGHLFQLAYNLIDEIRLYDENQQLKLAREESHSSSNSDLAANGRGIPQGRSNATLGNEGALQEEVSSDKVSTQRLSTQALVAQSVADLALDHRPVEQKEHADPLQPLLTLLHPHQPTHADFVILAEYHHALKDLPLAQLQIIENKLRTLSANYAARQKKWRELIDSSGRTAEYDSQAMGKNTPERKIDENFEAFSYVLSDILGRQLSKPNDLFTRLEIGQGDAALSQYDTPPSRLKQIGATLQRLFYPDRLLQHAILPFFNSKTLWKKHTDIQEHHWIAAQTNYIVAIARYIRSENSQVTQTPSPLVERTNHKASTQLSKATAQLSKMMLRYEAALQSTIAPSTFKNIFSEKFQEVSEKAFAKAAYAEVMTLKQNVERWEEAGTALCHDWLKSHSFNTISSAIYSNVGKTFVPTLTTLLKNEPDRRANTTIKLRMMAHFLTRPATPKTAEEARRLYQDLQNITQQHRTTPIWQDPSFQFALNDLDSADKRENLQKYEHLFFINKGLTVINKELAGLQPHERQRLEKAAHAGRKISEFIQQVERFLVEKPQEQAALSKAKADMLLAGKCKVHKTNERSSKFIQLLRQYTPTHLSSHAASQLQQVEKLLEQHSRTLWIENDPVWKELQNALRSPHLSMR